MFTSADINSAGKSSKIPSAQPSSEKENVMFAPMAEGKGIRVAACWAVDIGGGTSSSTWV